MFSARGGHGVARSAFAEYQRSRSVVLGDEPTPDLVVVAVDTNRSTFAAARKSAEDATDATIVNRLVAAAPDPHIERRYLADPPSLGRSSVVLPNSVTRSVNEDTPRDFCPRRSIGVIIRPVGMTMSDLPRGW